MARFQIVRGRAKLDLEGRSSLHPIHSSTTDLTGYLEATVGDDNQLDLTKAISGRLEVAVESLKAGNDLYDLEMRRRLDTRRYPTIVAELLQLRRQDGTDRYHATGSVTFHGATRRFEGELTLRQVDTHTIEARGERSFDVRDFGITPPKLLMLQVYPDILLRLNVVAKAVSK